MEKNPTEMDQTLTEQAETLWVDFERTGSIEAFLRFAKEAETKTVVEFVGSPS